MRTITTDYLVIGAGASGLAFADALIAESGFEVTLVDRRAEPGGHWLDSYPFVRLHSPSAYYGVGSLPLGEDRIDCEGENAGYYERASGREVCEHFVEAATKLASSGQMHLLAENEYLGQGSDVHQLRDLRTGAVREVEVRRKVVDARYLEASIPATHRPPFEVAGDAQVVPLNRLPDVTGSATSYTVLGSGKTAVDACTWLIGNGIEPERIRWVRPREAWFHHRRHFQPLDKVGANFVGISLDTEAAASAEDINQLFERLEQEGRLSRIDETVPARMYRGTMLSEWEFEVARQIEDVVRLGRVRRIEPRRILLERGEVASDRDVLHVDCTALGLRNAPPRPIFQPGRIVIQQVRHNSPSFNAALIAWVEAHREEDPEKNRLCPPNPYASRVEDWPRMMSRTWRTEARWLREPDLSTWVASTRLNLLAALPDHLDEPQVKEAVERYLRNVGPAIERLKMLEAH